MFQPSLETTSELFRWGSIFQGHDPQLPGSIMILSLGNAQFKKDIAFASGAGFGLGVGPLFSESTGGVRKHG
jgi:hypothetical protein